MNLEASQQGIKAGMRTLHSQWNHGVWMARYAGQIGDRKAHQFHMYTDAPYLFKHNCIELRINSLLNHEIFLIKAMTKGTMSMHVCMSKIGQHRRNFEAKSGPYFYPRGNTL